MVAALTREGEFEFSRIYWPVPAAFFKISPSALSRVEICQAVAGSDAPASEAICFDANPAK
jgi:hypothetical protein